MEIPDPWNDGSDEPCKGCGQTHPRHQKWSDPSLSRQDANMRAFMTVCKWGKAMKEAISVNGVEPQNGILFYWPAAGEQVGVGTVDGEWLDEGKPMPEFGPTMADIVGQTVEAVVSQEGPMKAIGCLTEAYVPNIENIGPADEMEPLEYYGAAVVGIGKTPPTNCMVAAWVYFDEESRVGCFGAIIPVKIKDGEVVCDTLMLAEVKPGELDSEETGPLTDALVAALRKSAA